MVGKVEIPEARELLESLLTMEENESMRLARQIGRMDDALSVVDIAPSCQFCVERDYGFSQPTKSLPDRH